MTLFVKEVTDEAIYINHLQNSYIHNSYREGVPVCIALDSAINE